MSSRLSFLTSNAPRVSSPPNQRSRSAPTPPAISIEDLSQDPLSNIESHPPSPTQPKRSDTAGTAATQQSSASSWRRRGNAWQRRHKSPGVIWRKRWDSEVSPFENGRVLIIDCFSRDHSDDGKRKTLAYEFSHEVELREFYETGPGSKDGHCLRIVHVQNARWARDFLLRKFNISDRGNNVAGLTGTSFAKWAVWDRPQRRAGKPVLNSKSFRCSRDPWRGISRTGFGVDYLKYYHLKVVPDNDVVDQFKLCELNHWDVDRGNVPAHGYDVYVQRMSVYIQRNEGPINTNPDGDMKSPYASVPTTGQTANGTLDPIDDMETLPLIESMDNNSTIIVFESSHTGYPEDTLIEARGEMEARWRRLMQLLPREDIPNEDVITVELMNIVIKDVYKALQVSWDKLLAKCDEHVNILEEKIYENPADESRAPELWTNSALWLKVEKLISLQISTIGEVQNNLTELADDVDPHEEWLHHTPDEFRNVETMVQEQLVKPTANLSDLMYKSVGIRDARHSLQLGLSMWRLSWITFIFLPLTFIGGFFGMNVDAFQPSGSGYPSIKWYFVAAVPLMCIVVVLYFMFKRADRFDGRHDPVQRGAYEHIFQDFAADFPALWTRAGPRADVRPRGLRAAVQWLLITYWFDPRRTVAARPLSDIDEMGLWARAKRRVARRWLAALQSASAASAADLAVAESGRADFGTVLGLLSAAPVALADGAPPAAAALRRPAVGRADAARSRAPRRRSHSSGSRPASGGVASPMVDEERSSDDDSVDRARRARALGAELVSLSPLGAPRPEDGPPVGAAASGVEQLERPAGPPTSSAASSRSDDGHVMHLGVPMNVRRGEEHAPP